MSVLTITEDNFEQEVMQSDKPVLLDFWATWCGPCQAFGPIFAAVAEEIDTAKFGKVNVDEQMDLARRFRVMSIPTLVLMKNGQPLQTVVGMRNQEGIKELLANA